MTRDNRSATAHNAPDRRRFLQSVGLGLAASTMVTTTGVNVLAEVESSGCPLKLGLASYTTRKFSLDETIAMAKRVDLPYLCLKSFHLPMDSTAEQLATAAKTVADAGLLLYGAGVVGMKSEADVTQAFEYAKHAGITTIVAAPDPKVLPVVNEHVQQYDIKIAIHNHGPGDKHFPTPEATYEQVKDLDPRMGLCMDIGHTLRIGADPIVDVERYIDRMHDLHIKDVTAAAPEGKTVEIGRGVIDIPKFLKTLLKVQYSGVASFEYEKDADDPLPGLSESVGYVRGVLATL